MSRVRTASLLVCSALLLATSAHALYKVVGPDGKVTYTDQPPAAEPANRLAAPAAGNAPSSASLPPGLRLPASRYPVTLYAARNCPPCDAGRNLLVQRGIPFSEKRVESAADIAALAQMTGGRRQLPLLTVGSQQVRSLSTAEWQATLDAAGYPATSQLPASYRRPDVTPLTSGASDAPANPPAAPAPVEPVETAPTPPTRQPGQPDIRF